ncbi:MAG TPA: HNH endonuclease signature motif containing protein [Planctomycetota bacterium]|nr:HNH endonuclease signature motif containing protein [Planctomycetota bacterium]
MCRNRPRFEDLEPPAQRALTRDAQLSAVARCLGALDLALGATLARLFEVGLDKLAYARESDYARERLQISPSEMFSCVKLARELRHRPILRQAVTAGAVSKRKALAVAPLAVGDYEGAWTEAAMRLSVRELESAAKAAGSAVPEDRFEAEVVVLPMTPEQQDRLDAALALAKQDLGPEAKPWQCMEVISLEFLSSFPEFDVEGPGEPGACAPDEPEPPRAPPRPMSRHAERVIARQLEAIGEALSVIAGIEKDHPGDDPLALDARARRLVAARRRYDETLGILARKFRRELCHETLGYSFDAYCEERLGMRAGAVRQRIWLEQRMEYFPQLRTALSSGRIGYSKALAVARRANWFDVDERLARAERTTCQQLEREAQAEERREHRKRGTRELWTPSDAAQAVRDAIAAAQRKALAEGGVAIDQGEALAVVADHFAEVKDAHMAPARRWMSEFRKQALMRKGGLCAVPGCSRAAVHVHHIVFRSSGGPDEPWNGVALCAVHHLHGIHLGYLEVTGRAGERLHWRFATGEAAPTEEWETLGDDDVWRRGFAGSSAGADAAGGPGAARAAVTDVESVGTAGEPGVAAPRDPAVTDVESPAHAERAARPPPDVLAETARAAYLHKDPRTDDRRWILVCEEAHAA